MLKNINNYVLTNPEIIYKFKVQHLEHIINKLDVLNPMNTLKRGYAIVKKTEKVITDIVGSNVSIINAGYETALYTKEILSAKQMLSDEFQDHQKQFFVSDDVDKFAHLGSMFLGQPIKTDVKKIDIETF